MARESGVWPRRVWMHYAGAGGVGQHYDVVVTRTQVGQDAQGTTRVYLTAVSSDRQHPRTFRADRVLDLAEPETGEIVDLQTTLRNAGIAQSVLATALRPATRLRRLNHGYVFAGMPPGVRGARFHVPPVFAEALDLLPILVNGRRPGASGAEAWSQGTPPEFKFDVGDVFYDWPQARRVGWADALVQITRMVQVVAATPDQVRDFNRVIPGQVSAAYRCVTGGRLERPRILELTQAEFVHLLWRGAPGD